MIEYVDIGADYSKYGFIKISTDKLIFSSRRLNLTFKGKRFVDKNFEIFGKCYYQAMVNDNSGSSSRKRRLINFIKSIYDQRDEDAALLMLKAMEYLLDKLTEEELVEKIIKVIMPGGGYVKSLNDNHRYLWKLDDDKKFSKGIGKAYVITYINNNFNKDDTWKYIKKHCYLKDGVWSYKTDKNRETIEKAFFSYFKNGGIMVKEVNTKDCKDFNAFIPLNKILDEDGNDFLSLDKAVAAEKNPIIYGVAATTSVDRDDERVSKNFIEKMHKMGKSLPILDNTHNPNSAKQTIGVVVETDGDENTFKITGKLMKPSKSEAVAFMLEQIATGIVYGFSVGGKVTKVYREFDEKARKEVYVLDDGEMYHVAATTQPANPDTLGVALRKSIISDKEGSERENLEYKHSSRLAKISPEITDIDVNGLPDVSFPFSPNQKLLEKKYPHHFVNDKGILYLHKDLLIKSFVEALKDNAKPAVLNHLVTHLQVIGLSKKIDELKVLSDNIESISLIKNISGDLCEELEEFFKTIASVAQLQNGMDDKKKILKTVITEVSTKISDILKPLEEEG